MSAPQWVETVLAEHYATGVEMTTPRQYTARGGWNVPCTCGVVVGETGDDDIEARHCAHVAAVLWAEFTARAQQAREDVAGAVHEADCGCLDWHPGDEEDHSYDIQADAAIAALLTAMGGAS